MTSAPNLEESLIDLLVRVFGHASFRSHQEEICKTVCDGQDVLLVMPTGSGKSLCYQLPGLARRGTTLVISPLIALIEDQVAKLKALGLRAERIHSGKSRAESRQVCVDYLAGQLDFLYIAPERLGVVGFPEMLAKRPPTLVAIDEAHCISNWGHDFRPEYRMLGERLPLLRPAVIMALTATATPRVQQDIATQLGFKDERRFILGFRRENIAIELVEAPKSERMRIIKRVLSEPERRPAILYAPTRKDAEAVAEELAREFPSAVYHAGMSNDARDEVQRRFLDGNIEIMVATIAFGMGVDKPNIRTVAHLALPQTLEGYYQEIGRAGRDGKPSRALLLHNYADRRLNEYFLERDYPEPGNVQKAVAALEEKGLSSEALKRRVQLPGYREEREYRWAQHEQSARFTETHGCRMLYLVRHFGDQEDSGETCGVCDICAPAECAAQTFRASTLPEQETMHEILDAVGEMGQPASGTLYRERFEKKRLDRDKFEAFLSGLTRARMITAKESSFQKNGARISFTQVSLTQAGRIASRMELKDVMIPLSVEKQSPARARKPSVRRRSR